MKLSGILSFLVCFVVVSVNAQQRPEADHIKIGNSDLTIQPIYHATLALSWNGTMAYVDPTGGAEAFKGLADPDLILITHAHGDHLDVETLQALNTEGVPMVVPQAVADKLPEAFSEQLVIMDNGDSTSQQGLPIKAMPMYNLPPGPDTYHPKGWGNGYVVHFGDQKVYLSGDTEGIDEMRSLQNVDVAFVCMNLPYTMDVEQAADAVLDFAPDIVYPYHYRGQDTDKFQQLVNEKNDQIEVRLRDWYMGRQE